MYPSCRSRFIPLLLLCLLPAWVQVTAATTPFRQENRRVVNVKDAVANLKHHGEPLAFRTDGAPYTLNGVPSDAHYQGIARIVGPGVPYLIVSSSRKSGDKKAALFTVEMGSRDTDGERFRSNRLEQDKDAGDTSPPSTDKVTAYRQFNWSHIGGIQACGDILAVPLEDANFTTSDKGRIMFFDISNPATPREFFSTITSTNHKFGVVGLIRLPDNHFLVAATYGDNDSVEFYRSKHTSFLESQLGWDLVYTWKPSELKGDYDWPTGKTSHQMLNFVLQEDGRLFLLGARNTSAATPVFTGKDELFLYEVTGFEANSTKITLTQSSEARHLYSHNAETGFADFLAGIGVYVSPLGELIVYATEHYNNGPDDSVRFVEFRNRDQYDSSFAYILEAEATQHEYFVREGSEIVLDASLSRGPLIKPWIELYDDDDFEGESLVMDYADRFKDDFQDLRKMSFNDRASSLRYWAPTGWKIILYDDDNFKTAGGSLTLNGGFGVQTISNLSDPPWKFDNGDLININETRVTSVAIVAPAIQDNYLFKPLTYAWSVADGPADAVKFEPTGIQSRLLAVNGPADVNVLLTVKGPGGAEDTVLVHVLNEPPHITGIRELHGLKGTGRVDVNVKFEDPGREDTHTVRVVWGDGAEETVNVPKYARKFSVSHTFPSNPDPLKLWTGSLRITDSDGDTEVTQVQFRPWTPLDSTVDTDQDGIPDGWELANLGWIGEDAQADMDADGVPNIAEFIRGGDPSVPDATTLTMLNDQNRLVVSFTAARGDLTLLGNRKRYYSVMQSTNLADWTVVPGGKDIVGADQVEKVRVPTSAAAAYFRLEVEAR